MVSDEDALGLLSAARPLMAKPLSAVTQTRDGFVDSKIYSAFLVLLVRVRVYTAFANWVAY